MSDAQCCICLSAQGTKVCGTCPCKVCTSCWNTYKLKRTDSVLPCPLCRNDCRIGPRTRSSTFGSRRTQLISDMRRLLTEVDRIPSLTPEKSRLIHTIFRTLCSYRGSDTDFMKNHDFRDACRQKLRTFYYEYGFDGAAGYYTRLFDEAISL